ncbi:hypothetical protein KBY76_12490 [Synechococcus sp. GreenBA-s]|nr:hypothetical protein [Synechococcus sp. GreenBA-s]
MTGRQSLSTSSEPPPPTAPTPTAASSGGGLWLSLERLRTLPLTPEARLALLRDLQASPQPADQQLPLTGELAEVTLRCCEDAYQAGRWLEALEHHDALLALVGPLAAALPDRAALFWARYGELLAQLTAAVHPAVNSLSADPPEPLLRAEICWRLCGRLLRAHGLPFTPPDWLVVLEQQLVQDGAAFWRDLAAQPAVGGDLARKRALELLLRLGDLLDPAPVWVGLQVRELLAAEATQLLDGPEPPVEGQLQLIVWLERLPGAADPQAPLAVALTRARLALELLAPQLGPRAPAPASSVTAIPEPAELATPLEPGVATLVLLPVGAEPSPLQLDLGPLLAAEFGAIEEALDDFVWHLPKGSRALPAAQALTAALEPFWRRGGRLSPLAFERLAYGAAAWQRCLGDRLQPLPPLDWQHSLVVELASSELAVLGPLLADPHALAPALAELRREHQNPEFWAQRQELPWMQCPPPLEALRRLYREEGFYASSHGPLESLRAWGQEAVLALQEAELWTDDAGCLGLWLATAQELVGEGQAPLPALGAPPAPEQLLAELGGLEVLYVGDQAAAVQAAHRAGRCFRGDPFGLRVLETPASRWPARPASGMDESLAVLLEAVDGLYRQRPFAVLLADCGAYRLPLLRAAHQRYGVAALSSGRPLAGWLAGEG